MEICPTCKRRMPVAKVTIDKRLRDDIVKAQFALDVCVRSTSRSDFPHGLQVACAEEAVRMQTAIETPALLWSIYRRRDKGTPYYSA